MKTHLPLKGAFALVLFSLLVVHALAQVTPLFLPVVDYATGGKVPVSVAIGDLNGDGKPDLVVANNNSNTVGVLFGNGDGTFRAVVTHGSGGRSPNSVVIADVNGDGKPDIVVANSCASTSCSKGSVGVLLGNGDGTFKPAVNYDSGGEIAWSVAVADVNGDGKPDVIVANSNNNTVGILLGNGDGTFKLPYSYPSGSNSFTGSLAVADLNGDGKPDLAMADWCLTYPNCTSGTVGVLLGYGNGSFHFPVTYSSAGEYAQTLAVGDVNEDGKPDLLIGNNCFSCGYYGEVSLLLGNGDGTFQTAMTNVLTQTVGSIAVKDVNGDGKLDLLVAGRNSQGGVVATLLGNGNGTFQSAVHYGSGGGTAPSSLAVADVDGNGKPDLLVANSNSIGVLLGNTNIQGSIFTTTMLVSSLNPSLIGQKVTFTATVSSSLGAPPDGETVTFADNSIVIATGALVGGRATFSISKLTAGTHNFKATYIGDTTFKKSSSVVQQVVNKYPTTTALSSSSNPSTQGQSVTFTATVSKVISTGPTPTGHVTFMDGSTVIGSPTLSNGVAILMKSTLAVGTHPITAQYMGDSTSAKSTSTVVSQVVN